MKVLCTNSEKLSAKDNMEVLLYVLKINAKVHVTGDTNNEKI